MSDKNRKEEALRLAAQGKSTKEISEILKVSIRTIQRWFKESDFHLVESTVERVKERAIEKVAESLEELIIDELKSQAIKLLKLSNKALDCLQETLDNPDARRVDKLRACQIVGRWTGMESEKNIINYSVQKYGFRPGIEYTDDFTSQIVVLEAADRHNKIDLSHKGRRQLDSKNYINRTMRQIEKQKDNDDDTPGSLPAKR